jgi:hypothetical protein
VRSSRAAKTTESQRTQDWNEPILH